MANVVLLGMDNLINSYISRHSFSKTLTFLVFKATCLNWWYRGGKHTCNQLVKTTSTRNATCGYLDGTIWCFLSTYVANSERKPFNYLLVPLQRRGGPGRGDLQHSRSCFILLANTLPAALLTLEIPRLKIILVSLASHRASAHTCLMAFFSLNFFKISTSHCWATDGLLSAELSFSFLAVYQDVRHRHVRSASVTLTTCSMEQRHACILCIAYTL